MPDLFSLYIFSDDDTGQTTSSLPQSGSHPSAARDFLRGLGFIGSQGQIQLQQGQGHMSQQHNPFEVDDPNVRARCFVENSILQLDHSRISN